jgi:hypothetical protein
MVIKPDYSLKSGEEGSEELYGGLAITLLYGEQTPIVCFHKDQNVALGNAAAVQSVEQTDVKAVIGQMPPVDT